MRATGADWSSPHDIVLVEVGTGRVVTSSLNPDVNMKPVAYLPSRIGFLVVRQLSGLKLEAFLVTPDGNASTLDGEVGPFLDALRRPLQVRHGGGYWAALPSSEGGTDLCVFEPETLRFQLWMKLPGVAISSDKVWVQEEKKVVDIILDGDLIEVPLGEKPPDWI